MSCSNLAGVVAAGAVVIVSLAAAVGSLLFDAPLVDRVAGCAIFLLCAAVAGSVCREEYQKWRGM